MKDVTADPTSIAGGAGAGSGSGGPGFGGASDSWGNGLVEKPSRRRYRIAA